MKQTRQIMGMPVTIMCSDDELDSRAFDEVFNFFEKIDASYSPYSDSSDVSMVNSGQLREESYSRELRDILKLAEETKQQTDGFFNVWHKDNFDPSGIVKGWAIQQAAVILAKYTNNFYIEAGGDIQTMGKSSSDTPWRVGIRNPFERTQNIAIVQLDNMAVATSGIAIRGQHIYNPHADQSIEGIVSLSVIGDHIVDADRFATAAFAMGTQGINFIESLVGFEGYMVDSNKIATMTSGWEGYTVASL